MHSSTSHADETVEVVPGLLRLARRLAGAPEADDLVQSAVLRSLEHGAPVRRRKAWLRQVLVNEQRMQVRGRQRRLDRERVAADVGDEPRDVEEVVHCLEVARIVEDLMDELDDDVRLVVRERYFHGDSAAEIARRHRIPAGTVRWRLKSGLDRLRDELDARYGGRRELWAGGFLPASLAPTHSLPVASQPATAGTTSVAAGKGTSAMSMKIILAAGLLTASTGAAAWVATQEPDAERAATAEPTAVSSQVVGSNVSAKSSAEPDNEVTVSPEQARWAQKLSAIRQAHAQQASEHHADHGSPPAEAGQESCDGEHVGICTEEGCAEELAMQVLSLVEGCHAFMSDAGHELTLHAEVVGAPDVGTVVESVELSSDEETPEQLQECLTESMYALDLGPAEQSFDQTITVQLGTEVVRSAGEGAELDGRGRAIFHGGAEHGSPLDDETRRAIDQALAENPEARVQVIRMGDEPPEVEVTAPE